ncbi:hypothetical protein H5410_042566 [Solanum commersonii]|uniref:Uncharacterized protein n=1 Tax=Solanum commersonii TaxID=4109 RepID=A0A9J5XXZ7_SOLCO|nr:hypothetical protein H5410_042566 [Solanum commersonii]
MTIFLQILFPETSNMDNQTKILVNRIYEKMKTVDESIDDKSQKLFKIRDEEKRTKVFSPFQVGKQHPQEEEYLTFTIDIYNLSEESRETFVYTKPDLNELSQLPQKLFDAVKNYAQGNGVYYRFFSISMKGKDLQAYYPTLNYISVEKIKDFNVKATGIDKKTLTP